MGKWLPNRMRHFVHGGERKDAQPIALGIHKKARCKLLLVYQTADAFVSSPRPVALLST